MKRFPTLRLNGPVPARQGALGGGICRAGLLGQALRTATPEVRLTINQLDSIIRKRYGEHCADRRLARTRVMQQRSRVLAALTAIVCAAFVGCNACAQLYNNEYTCVAGRSCCVGWPNSPDRVCGTYEELKSEAIRCNLVVKSLINPPWQLIHRCGVYQLAAQKVEGMQRYNA